MPTIAIDFDGCIHKYSKGFHNGTCYDKPVPGALEAIQKLSRENKVVIFTAREDLDEVRAWLIVYQFGELEVTNKKPRAKYYIDDRAIRFTNWTDILNYF